jgi:hypothetical protein
MSVDEATASGGNDQTSDAEFAVRSNATVDTDVKEAARVAKKVKPSVRDAINKARKDLARGRNNKVGANAINVKRAPASASTASCGTNIIKDKVHATVSSVISYSQLGM